jgi:ribonuclease P protein component
MLPKENRLKKEREFEAVFKDGRTFKGNCVFLKYLINGTDKTKVGFVVSKKISKLATKRNKIKRRMREIVRLEKGKIKEGLSIIFIALPAINNAGYEEMEKDIGNLLNREELAKQ